MFDYIDIGPGACPLTCNFGDSCGSGTTLEPNNVCEINTSCTTKALDGSSIAQDNTLIEITFPRN